MNEKFLQGGYKLDDNLKKEISNVESIIRETVMDFHNYVFPKYIMNYKDYLGFVAERVATIDNWQSNINYPMISSTIDTMFGNIFDFGFEFGIKELGLKQLCTKAFDFRGTGKKVFKEVVKEILICGKGYTKDFFIKEEHDDNFFGRNIKQTIKTPSILYLSVFDVMYDRSKGLENSSYKIIRSFTSGDSIKAKVLPLLLETYTGNDKSQIEKRLSGLLKEYKNQFGHRFSMYDYNPVKSLTATSQWFDFMKVNKEFFTLPVADKYIDMISGYGGVSMNETAKNYFLNDDKSSYELVEYITNTERYIFINGYLIYFGPKRYNLGDIREATYSILPGTGNASGVADKLQGLQRIQNTLWNASIDNIKLLLGPMFSVTGNIPVGKNGQIDFRSFRAIKTNGAGGLEKVQMGVNDFSSMNLMQIVDTAGQKETGMSNYVLGGGGAIERTQGGIDLKFNQYKSKLTPITDSIDQMMGNIARSWIMMYLKFFTKEELGKLGVQIEEVFKTNEKGKEVFDTLFINGIDIKDVINETNITFTYNSLDKVTKEGTRDTITMNLMPLLQYAQGSLNMEELGKVLAGQDFNPLKLLQSKKEQSPEKFIPKQYQQQQGYQQQQPTPKEEFVPDETMAEDQYGEEQNLLEQLQNIS